MSTTTMAITVCCFFIGVMTLILTYVANRTLLDKNTGAAAGLWLTGIFLSIALITSMVGGSMSQQYAYNYNISEPGYGQY